MGSLTQEKTKMRSVKQFKLDLKVSAKSLIYIMSDREPPIEPFWPPQALSI